MPATKATNNSRNMSFIEGIYLSFPWSARYLIISPNYLQPIMAVPVYYVDKNRIITFWNKAAERLTGYSQSEVLGSSCSDNAKWMYNEGCSFWYTISARSTCSGRWSKPSLSLVSPPHRCLQGLDRWRSQFLLSIFVFSTVSLACWHLTYLSVNNLE